MSCQGAAVCHRRGVEGSSSPGGKEENTGNASKLSDKLTMGTEETICIEPVKLLTPRKGPKLAAPCAPDGSERLLLASFAPVAICT